MALKHRITKAEYEKLTPAMQAEYKSNGAGDDENYTLDVEGLDDAGELRRANERNKAEAAANKLKATKAEEELAELKRTGNRNTNDIVALEKSWKDTADAREAAAKGETKRVKGQLRKVLVNDIAKGIAEKISKSPMLLLPHILKRIDAEIPDDGSDPVTRVLDKDGKPSALTVAELEKEIVSTKEFADIIIASRASGGGASGNQGGGATKKPSEYSAQDRIELHKRDPAEYKRIFPPQL